MTTRDAALRGLATGLEIALRSVQSLIEAGDPDEWIDQRRSPLGRRAHCEAVRRGDLPGRKLRGRVLVRRRDLDAYVEQHGVRRASVSSAASEADEAAEILAFKAPRRRKAA
jgi:hypothetical protein